MFLGILGFEITFCLITNIIVSIILGYQSIKKGNIEEAQGAFFKNKEKGVCASLTLDI